jgi:23S rRNA (adenine2503-C2)-methyltransferase
MPGSRNKADLRIKSIWEEEAIEGILLNKRHRNKMWNWLIQHPDKEIHEIPFRDWSVPREAAAKIVQGFVKYSTKIVQKKESSREDTTKLLVRLQDGHEVETVVMKHAHHATVCVSSQIGCQMGCRYVTIA